MAQYRAICDLWLPNDQYAEAGDIVSDVGVGVSVPVGWKPPLGVDPIDADGMKAFFDLGPGQAPGSAEHGTLSVVFCANRWTGKVVAPASHYWKPVMMGGHRVWMVNGAESLGYKDDL